MSKREKDKEQNVTVGVRIRPFNEKEKAAGMKGSFRAHEDGCTVQQLNENGDVEDNIGFNHVFGPSETNKTIFEKIGPKLVDAAMEAWNTVLFMYGQTSSGKTYTLFGGHGSPGLIQYAMDQVNHRIDTSENMEFVVRFSYTELYIDEIKDLFGTTTKNDFKIVDHPLFGPVIQDITEIFFESGRQVMEKITQAESRRHFSATAMNEHSSRSHVIVRLTIESRKTSPGQKCQKLKSHWAHDEKPQFISTLNMVDLAGSESSTKSNTKGQALKEGNAINLSLLTLGNVINALTEGRGRHVPYRDSNLTRLLQSALGGNAKTILITCLSPAEGNKFESLNTLKFATRAKLIVNTAKKNEFAGDAKTMTAKLMQQAAEIESLRSQISLSIELGYNPAESGSQRDSLKTKAVQASKNWRNLRFLVSTAPKIVKALKATKGSADCKLSSTEMNLIVKKVQNDLKDAMSGTRELSEIISEHANYIETYLPHEFNLRNKIENLTVLNESDVIVSDEGFYDNEDDDGGDESGGTADKYNSDSFDFGESEEIQEKLENAQFLYEDFRVFVCTRIEELEQECAEFNNREKLSKKEISDLNNQVYDLQETIKTKTQNEANLNKTIEDLNTTHQEEKEAHNTAVSQLNACINELTCHLDDKESNVMAKTHENMAKEGEIEKLRTQCEQLTKDLAATVASRKQYEAETTKSRNEMKTQMEKLRGNMHDLLRQGGEEAKVIESQNSDLQRDLDTARDQLVMLGGSKDRMEVETSHLRMEIAIMKEALKSKEEQITVNGNEATEQSQKLRDMRLEITRINAALNASKQDNNRLQSELKTQRQNHEESLQAKQKESDELKAQFDTKFNDLTAEVDSLEGELKNAYEHRDAKQQMISKLEFSFNADTMRFEKKLAQQVKISEELQSELSQANSQAQYTHNKHVDEVRVLKNRINELQGHLDSIDRYLEAQVFPPSYNEEEGSSISAMSGLVRVSSADSTDDIEQRNRALTSTSLDDAYMSPMSRIFKGSMSSYIDTDEKKTSKDGSPSNVPSSTGRTSLVQLFSTQTTVEKRVSISSAAHAGAGAGASSSATPTTPGPPYRMSLHSPLRTISAATTYPFYKQMMSSGENGEGGQDSTVQDGTEASDELFRNILKELTCATKTLESSSQQSALLHSYMLSQHNEAMRLIDTEEAVIEDLKINEKHLSLRLATSEDTVAYVREKESKVSEQKNILAEANSQLKRDLYAANRDKTMATAKADSTEQKYLDLKVQLEKLSVEKRQSAALVADLQRANAAANTRLEEATDELHRLDTKHADLTQQFAVLETERNELMKRFLDSHSRTNGSATSPQQSSYAPSPARKYLPPNKPLSPFAASVFSKLQETNASPEKQAEFLTLLHEVKADKEVHPPRTMKENSASYLYKSSSIPGTKSTSASMTVTGAAVAASVAATSTVNRDYSASAISRYHNASSTTVAVAVNSPISEAKHMDKELPVPPSAQSRQQPQQQQQQQQPFSPAASYSGAYTSSPRTYHNTYADNNRSDLSLSMLQTPGRGEVKPPPPPPVAVAVPTHTGSPRMMSVSGLSIMTTTTAVATTATAERAAADAPLTAPLTSGTTSNREFVSLRSEAAAVFGPSPSKFALYTMARSEDFQL